MTGPKDEKYFFFHAPDRNHNRLRLKKIINQIRKKKGKNL